MRGHVSRPRAITAIAAVNAAGAVLTAAFWGLVAGFLVSWLLERGDFAAARAASQSESDKAEG